jgi:hypothetical protein
MSIASGLGYKLDLFNLKLKNKKDDGVGEISSPVSRKAHERVAVYLSVQKWSIETARLAPPQGYRYAMAALSRQALSFRRSQLFLASSFGLLRLSSKFDAEFEEGKINE